MANDIKLGSHEHPISEDLSTVTVGGERTSLEISKPGGGARVNGGLEVTGDIKGNIVSTDLLIDDITCDDLRADGSTVNIQNLEFTKDSADQVITGKTGVDVADIKLDFNAMAIHLDGALSLWDKADDLQLFTIYPDAQEFIMYDDGNHPNDYFKILVAANGVTTLTTVDGAGEGADLILNIDGYVDINSASGEDITLDSGKGIIIDVAATKFVEFKEAGNVFASIRDNSGGNLVLKESAGGTDFLLIATTTNGATEISTTDAAGEEADLTLNIDGKITLDSATGEFEMHGAGTVPKFADMYAGMILGYTRIQNDGTGAANNAIVVSTSSMTVLQTDQGTDFSIQFIVPPSGNVEIQCSFWMQANSDGAKFSLSTGTSYAELGITHTYDADYTVFIDESDHNFNTVSFSVTGLTAGTDTTYYLAGLASGAGVVINHGRFRTTGNHYPPIILKAIALPATIVTGE